MPLDSALARRARHATRNFPALYAVLKRFHHGWIARSERRRLQREHPAAEFVDLDAKRLAGLRAQGFMSQFGQDDYLVRNGLVPAGGGRFLDIGCNDPRLGSNSWYFETRCGYSGLAVDPLGTFAERWAEERPATRFVQAFVSDATEPVEFTRVSGEQGWEHMLSGAADSVTVAGKKVCTETFRLPPVSLAALLEGEGTDFAVDVMFLDVEGHELPVLRSAPWERGRPGVIVAENEGPPDKQRELREFLAQREYVLVARISIFDDVFVRQG